jgi:hypothetical protein
MLPLSENAHEPLVLQPREVSTGCRRRDVADERSPIAAAMRDARSSDRSEAILRW